ncbi:sensor domain-containing diguanylate cyclase [Cellulomonas endophytica]|uniref:GGDEF domain-containing protein n=1 Tax=Cellulomonas endophytica TaxID=2494735 RepID=UPI001011152C|nr:GGDEF domain-containing protein [Cellulomonas endophytica]
MPARRGPRGVLTPALRSAGFAAAYLVALLLGRATAGDASHLSLVYPAAGVAAVWFLAQRRQPTAVLDHVLLVGLTLAVNLHDGLPVATSVGVSLARVAQVHVFGRLLRRWWPSGWGQARALPVLALSRDVWPLVGASVVSGLAAAVFSFTGAALGGGAATPLVAVLLVVRASVSVLLLGTLVLRLTPLLLPGDGEARVPLRERLDVPHGTLRQLELALAVVLSAVVCGVVFSVLELPLAFCLFAVTLWIALRFSTTITVLHDFVVSVVVAVVTVAGHGAFAAIESRAEEVLVAQAFVALLSVVGLALSTGRDDRAALAAELRGRALEAEATTRRVQRLADASTEIAAAADPRAALCHAVAGVTGAASAFLMEPDGHGLLVSTGAHGWDRPVRLSMADESITLDVYCSGVPDFVPDAGRDARVAPTVRETVGAASLAWQPVRARGGVTVAVLVVVLADRRTGLDERDAAMLQTLAGEASHLIERADLLARLEVAAERDPLTGLPNRRRWDATASGEIARAQRHGTPLTFAMIDLDHFKHYNDAHGHLAGDDLLTEFARRVGLVLREMDTVARWGGEEFALALPGCTASDAAELARRIQAVVPAGQTCTIGVAQWEPGLTSDDVVARADGALYRGKRGGRDLVAVHGRALPGVIPSPSGAAGL